MRYGYEALRNMPNLNRGRWTSAIVGVAMLASCIAAQAATVPYTEDFNDEPVGATTGPSEASPESGTLNQASLVTLNLPPAPPTAPTGTGSAAFTVDSEDNYQMFLSANRGNSTNTTSVTAAASLQFTDLATGDFHITADVARDAVGNQSNNGSTFGSLVARAAGPDLTSSTSGYRLVLMLASGNNITMSSLNRVGRLRLEEGGAGAFTTVASADVDLISITTDVFRTLSLTGTVNGTTLDLVGTVSDTAGNVLVTLSANDPSPQNGGYFGLRSSNTSSSGTQTATIDYDNVSISALVPEPAGMAMLAIGAMGSLRRRRRA